MASPQKEHGFTSIAHEILEALASCKIPLSHYEWKIIMFLFRKTYGWKKTNDQISLSQFAEGTKTHRAHASRAIQKLIRKNIISSTQIGTSQDKKYCFQKDHEKWELIPNQVLDKLVPNQVLELVPNQVLTSTKTTQKLVPNQVPTIDTTKDNNKRYLKIEENQVNLESILATMENDIINIKATGKDEHWIKNVYLNLGVPEVKINEVLGKLF